MRPVTVRIIQSLISNAPQFLLPFETFYKANVRLCVLLAMALVQTRKCQRLLHSATISVVDTKWYLKIKMEPSLPPPSLPHLTPRNDVTAVSGGL